jgi:TolB protein
LDKQDDREKDSLRKDKETMNEIKVSLTTKVARVAAMVLVAMVATLAALQALSAQPAQASSFSKIAFESHRAGNSEIYTMNSDGTGVRRLTFNIARDENPSISADGSKIAFETNRSGNWEIYTMNSDGSGQRRITWSSAQDTEPSLSPDGNKIVYASDRDNHFGEIYSIENLAGFPQITTRLTFNSAPDHAPSVSTSGKIAFSRASGEGNDDIYTMNSDGTGLRRITANSAPDQGPSLSPGASTIHYLSFRDDPWGEIYRINSTPNSAGSWDFRRLTFNSVIDRAPG